MGKFLIIGGSSGIGKATAELLVNNGHQVIATYNNTQPDSNNIEYHHLDVLSNTDIDFIQDELDGLLYCPGSIPLMPFRRVNAEGIQKDMQLHVIGAVNIIQNVLTNLKKSDAASIVLMSSVAAETGFNFHSQISICKGAINGLTKALSAELAPKIRINAVAPSLTNTPMTEGLLNTEEKIKANEDRHPLKKIGSDKDLANAIEFLLTDKSAWVSGQILSVDGGIGSIR